MWVDVGIQVVGCRNGNGLLESETPMSVMVLFMEMLDRWMICTIDIVLWS